MTQRRIVVATIAISILTAGLAAGPALASRDTPAAAPVEAGSMDWPGVVQALSDPAAGLIRVDAPDALALELEALSAEVQAAAQAADARWGLSFAIDGAQAPGTDGRYDFDRIDEVARPETPAWCERDAPYAAIDAAGVRRIWQQCRGTPAGEDVNTISVRRFWIEDTVAGDYRWLEFTAVSATNTDSQLAILDTFSREALGAITRNIVTFPAAYE
ncbi:hypothetical protein [Maricaulis sp.]|uniref:hypothetical protein n=1 Tax=Maricaulis sp. TaxID=1486257 RepID=UPI003A9369E2